jgi:endogenous inhibitor of DNA gyrase (YacG/DUF329 family)
MSICPICGAEVKPRSVNKAHPFCSPRCKSIDLGKWLDEEYRVPDQALGDGDGDELVAEGVDDASRGKPDMRH